MKYLILLLLFISCGTRHAEIIKKDSIHIENNYSQGSKIVLGNTFVYKPFDALKPMIIDNVVYKNVIITNDKTIVKTKWNNRNITKTITVEKQKSTDKKDDANLWIGMFLILVIAIWFWFYFKKGI